MWCLRGVLQTGGKALAQKSTKRKTGSSGTSARTTRSGTGRSSAAKRKTENAFFRKEAAVIGLFALALLLFLSNFGLCGAVGNFFRSLQTGLFGVLGFVFPVFLAGMVIYALYTQGTGTAFVKIPAAVLVCITLAALVHLFRGGEPGKSVGELYAEAAGGGVFGGVICGMLRSALGTIGAALVLIVLFILLMVLITERSFVGAVRSGSGKAYRHAREDLGHYREERNRRMEERRLRQEERRRLAEEERAREFDLASTDLSKIPKQSVPAADAAQTGTGAPDVMSGLTAGTQAGESTPGILAGTAEQAQQIPAQANMPAEPEWTRKPDPAEAEQDWMNPDEEDELPLGEEYMEELPDPLAGRTPVPAAEERAGSSIPVIEENDFISTIRTEIPVGRDAAEPSAVAEDPYLEEAFAKADAILNGAGNETRTADSRLRPAAVIPKADPASIRPLPPVVPARYETPEYQTPEYRTPSDQTPSYQAPLDQTAPYRATDYSLPEDDGEDEISITLPDRRDAETAAPPESTSGEGVYEPYGFENAPEEEAPEIDLEKIEHGPLAPAAKEQSRQEAEDPDARVIVTSSGKVLYGEKQRVEQLMEEKRRAQVPQSTAVQSASAQAPQAQYQPKQNQYQPQQAVVDLNAPPEKEYKLPPLDLLEKGTPVNDLAGENEFHSIAEKLETTCRSFGVDVTVTSISRGPTVTRYELLPAPGVKVARIVALSDDIKLSLAAADIRIEAPIPGKSAVGIEVPNQENQTVYLRDLLESDQFRQSRAKIAFAVGKDIGGQVVVTDITKMPHMLIAGATGSGKSVCINTLIMSILFRYKPQDVKLIMVDPKVVELSVYNGIPHLLIPVVTDPKKAAGALNWAVAEMTDRYKKFASTGVRDLKGYNERIRKAKLSGTVDPAELPEELPQIVIIIDELADLMMVAQHEVEESICRLAQLARAAGLHLIIATQRPSVNVITGLIKANIPSRIAFAVSSGVDSRTILDGVGAEKLLGKGDMLFAPQGAPRPVRIQGAFVSDAEVQAVVDFIKEEELPLSYSKETVAKIERSADTGGGASPGRDELFAQAGRFLIEKKKATIGNLQRMFKIGFNRAARIMDQLYEAGVVGEEQGTKPREIIMTAEQFEELLRNEE